MIGGACTTSPARPLHPVMPDSAAKPSPPVAAVRSHVVRSPNGDRVDEYYWLRDDTRKDPDVIGYLEAENAYLERDAGACEAARRADVRRDRRAHQAGRLQRALSGSGATGITVRYETGSEYPIHARKAGHAGRAGTGDAGRQRARRGLRFLPGRRAGGQSRTTASSPTPKTTSAVASGRSASRISRPARRCPTGSSTPRPDIAWAADNRTVFYVEKHPETLLRLQGPQARDRDGSERRSGRLRAGRHELLHVGRHDQGRTLRRHPRAQHGRERAALRRRRESGRVEGLPAARARSPLRRRAPRRPLDHPDELEGAELTG